MAVVRCCLLALLAIYGVAGCSSGDRPDLPPQDSDPVPAVAESSAGLPEHTPETGGSGPETPPAESIREEVLTEESPQVEDTIPDRPDSVVEQLPPDGQWKTWCESLMSGSAESRRSAAEAIAQTLGPLTAGELASLLAHDSPFVRRCVGFHLLERVDPNDPDTSEALIRALSDADATVRHIALSAVRRLPVDKQVAALPQLTAMLTSERETAPHRVSVIRLIGSLEHESRAALPVLTQLLRTDREKSVRSAAAVALVRITDSDQAAKWLAQALADEPDPSVRAVLVARLGRIGQPAAIALDSLSHTLDSDDPQLQRAVIDAMIAIGRPSVPQLTAHLASSDVRIRRLAVFALGSLGPVASEATGPLQACLDDADAEVRQLAEIALSRVSSSR